MSLAKKLQALRINRGLSQEALAAQLNVSRQTVEILCGTLRVYECRFHGGSLR